MHNTYRSQVVAVGLLVVLFLATGKAAVIESGNTQFDFQEERGWLRLNGSLVAGGTSDGSVEITEGNAISIGRHGNIYLGAGPGVQGTLTLKEGSQILNNGILYAGSKGIGHLNITSGSSVKAIGGIHHTSGYLGYKPSGVGYLKIDGVGSYINFGQTLAVGLEGHGDVRVLNGGALNVRSHIFLGQNEASTGDALISGQGSLAQASGLHVGYNGSGRLQVLDGAVVTTQFGRIGRGNNSTGSALISGEGSVWRSQGNAHSEVDFFVGRTGSLNVESGGLLETGGASVYGTVTLDGEDSKWSNVGGVNVNTDGVLELLLGSTMSIDGTLKVEHFVRFPTNIDGGLIPGALNRIVTSVAPSELIIATGTIRLDNSVIDTKGLWALPESFKGVGVINTTSIVGDHDLLFDAAHGYTKQIILDSEPGQHVTINLDASDKSKPSPLGVGYVGNAKLRIADGYSINSSEAFLGYGNGSFGEAVVTGKSSEWLVDKELYIGKSGKASLLVADSAKVRSRVVHVGSSRGSEATVKITGSNSILVAGRLEVAEYGGQHVAIEVVNGGHLRTGLSLIGVHSNAQLTVSGPASRWDATSSVFIGHRQASNAKVFLNDGATLTSGEGYIGKFRTSKGMARIQGPGTSWNLNDDLCIGCAGEGSLLIEDGGLVTTTNDTIVVGEERNGVGEIVIEGNESKLEGARSMVVGRYGSANLRIMAGGMAVAKYGTIGTFSGSNGKAIVSGPGAGWIINNKLQVGLGGEGLLQINLGGLVVANELLIDYDESDDSFINMSSGGMLALAGLAEASLEEFLGLVEGTDAIRYWDADLSGWSPLAEATLGEDYTLEYLSEGELVGYTMLTVGIVPEPSTAFFTILTALWGIAHRRRY